MFLETVWIELDPNTFFPLSNSVVQRVSEYPVEMIEAILDTVCRLEPAAIGARIQCALIDLDQQILQKASSELSADLWLEEEKTIMQQEFCGIELSQPEANAIQLDGMGWTIEWRQAH